MVLGMVYGVISVCGGMDVCCVGCEGEGKGQERERKGKGKCRVIQQQCEMKT